MARERDGDERESIWSVPKATKTAYFVLFIIHFIAGMSLLVWKGEQAHESLADHVLYIWLKSGAIALGAAAAALMYAETGRYLLVLSRSLEEKLEKTREQRREEGREEERAKWRAWLGRMREAQAKGEPFDEPAPSERDVQSHK